jgi:hypothetical protein
MSLNREEKKQMGIYGSVVVFPEAVAMNNQPQSQQSRLAKWWHRSQPKPPPMIHSRAEHTLNLHQTTRSVLNVFELLGLIHKGTADSAIIDRDTSFATSSIIETPDKDSPADLQWAHAAVDAARLCPAISSLIFTMTEKEYNANPDMEPDTLALPYLDISVFSHAVAPAPNEMPHVISWAFVEFNFADCRLDEEIHRIRDDSHPLFSELGRVFGCPVKWDVVCG